MQYGYVFIKSIKVCFESKPMEKESKKMLLGVRLDILANPVAKLDNLNKG